MRSIRPSFTARRGRGRRRASTSLTAVALVSALALTATACNGDGDDNANGDPAATATAAGTGDGKITISDDLKRRLKEHGFDIDKWKNGAWKDWNRDDWLREANDFINPIIKGPVGPGPDAGRRGPGPGCRRQRHLR